MEGWRIHTGKRTYASSSPTYSDGGEPADQVTSSRTSTAPTPPANPRDGCELQHPAKRPNLGQAGSPGTFSSAAPAHPRSSGARPPAPTTGQVRGQQQVVYPVLPPGFIPAAYPWLPIPTQGGFPQPLSSADGNKDGIKAVECLMSLLVDEVRDVKRRLVGVQQELSDLRKQHNGGEKQIPQVRNIISLPEPYQTIHSSLVEHLPFLSRYPLFSSQAPFIIKNLEELSKPIIALKILEQRGVVPPAIVWANDPYCSLLQYSQAELVELPLLRLTLLDQLVTNQLQALFLKEPDASLMSEPVKISPLNVKKDGSMIRYASRMQLFYNAKKSPKWAIIVVDGVEEENSVILREEPFWIPGLPRWWERLAEETASRQGTTVDSWLADPTLSEEDFNLFWSQMLGQSPKTNQADSVASAKAKLPHGQEEEEEQPPSQSPC